MPTRTGRSCKLVSSRSIRIRLEGLLTVSVEFDGAGGELTLPKITSSIRNQKYHNFKMAKAKAKPS